MGRWWAAVAGGAGSCLVALSLLAPASAATASATGHESIVDFGFSPATITVAAGGTVTWVNTGASVHSVTSDDGGFDSSPSCPTGSCLDPGSSYSHRFAEAGRFSYHCRVHSTMTGTVVVTASSASTTTTTRATPGTTAPANRPVSTGRQLAFTGAPADEAWLTLGALLMIAVGLALAPRRRRFPIPIPVGRPEPPD